MTNWALVTSCCCEEGKHMHAWSGIEPVRCIFLLHWVLKVLAGQMHPFLGAAVQDYKDCYTEISSERDQWFRVYEYRLNELQLLRLSKKREVIIWCVLHVHTEKRNGGFKFLQCSSNYKSGNLFWSKPAMRNSQVSCTNGPSSSAFCLLWWQRVCCLERACKFGPFLASDFHCTSGS